MKIEELQPGLIVQDGKETLKVSTIYNDNRVSAQVVLPVPRRTLVRFYTAERVFLHWSPVSSQKYNEYVDAYSANANPWTP